MRTCPALPGGPIPRLKGLTLPLLLTAIVAIAQVGVETLEPPGAS
jgi:hypothetical protein